MIELEQLGSGCRWYLVPWDRTCAMASVIVSSVWLLLFYLQSIVAHALQNVFYPRIR